MWSISGPAQFEYIMMNRNVKHGVTVAYENLEHWEVIVTTQETSKYRSKSSFL